MADFIRVFGLDLPAGNGNYNFNPYDTPLGLAEVEKIDIIFPPGCSNLVGVSVNVGGQQFYPPEGDPQIRLDDARLEIPVSNQVNSGQWAVVAFNIDTFDHYIQVIYYCNYVVYSPSPSLSPVVAL